MGGGPEETAAIRGTPAYHAAVGDILRTLGRAPFDLDAILQAIVSHAVELSRTERGFVRLLGEDGRYHHAADVGAPEAIVAYNRANPITPTRATLTGRTAIERRAVHIPDVEQDPEYDYPEAQRLGGFRAMLGVPMLREGKVVGVVRVWRDEPVLWRVYPPGAGASSSRHGPMRISKSSCVSRSRTTSALIASRTTGAASTAAWAGVMSRP
jgi:GAF domain